MTRIEKMRLAQAKRLPAIEDRPATAQEVCQPVKQTPPNPESKTSQRKAAKKALYNDRGRLPDGSTFAVHYDAKAEKWTGSLQVPGGEATQVFHGTLGGLFRLLQGLDLQYRQWLAKHGAAK